jgi:hypothetical protein
MVLLKPPSPKFVVSSVPGSGDVVRSSVPVVTVAVVSVVVVSVVVVTVVVVAVVVVLVVVVGMLLSPPSHTQHWCLALKSPTS